MIWLVAKVTGTILVLASCSAAGFLAARACARRVVELRELRACLSVLASEIAHSRSTLGEACRRAAHAAGPPASRLMEDVAGALESGQGRTATEVWLAAVESFRSVTALREDDLDGLRSLHAGLGATGRDDQLRLLRLADDRLAASERSAVEARGRYETLYRYAGVLFGLSLVLVFV